MWISNRALLSVPAGFPVTAVVIEQALVVVTTRTIGMVATCPICGVGSGHVHNRYWRTLAGLPWQEHLIVLRVQVRRFHCQHCGPHNPYERLPGLVCNRAADGTTGVRSSPARHSWRRLPQGRCAASPKAWPPTSTLCKQFSRSPGALEQWTRRGIDQPLEAHRAADARPCQVQSAPSARLVHRLTTKAPAITAALSTECADAPESEAD